MSRNLFGHSIRKRNYNEMISSSNSINNNNSEQNSNNRQFLKIVEAKVIVDPKDINNSARKIKVTPENELKNYLKRQEESLNDSEKKINSNNNSNFSGTNKIENFTKSTGHTTDHKKIDNIFNPFTQVYNTSVNPFQNLNVSSTNPFGINNNDNHKINNIFNNDNNKINNTLNNDNNKKNNPFNNDNNRINNDLNNYNNKINNPFNNDNNKIYNPFNNENNKINNPFNNDNNKISNPFNNNNNQIFNPFNNNKSISNPLNSISINNNVKSTNDIKNQIFNSENSILSFNFNTKNEGQFKEEDDEESEGSFDPEEEVPINGNSNNENIEKNEIKVKNEHKIFDVNVESFYIYNWIEKKYVSNGNGKISIEKYNLNNKDSYYLVFRNTKTMNVLFQGNIISNLSNIENKRIDKLLVFLSRIYNYDNENKEKEKNQDNKLKLNNNAIKIHFESLNDLENFCNKFNEVLILLDPSKNNNNLKTPGKNSLVNNSHCSTYDKKIQNSNLKNESINAKSESKIKNTNEENEKNECLSFQKKKLKEN